MKTVGLVLAVAGFALSACAGATHTFITSHRPPKAEPLDLKGEKVAAVVMAKEPSLRRAGEDALARELTERGAQGIPMYVILPGDSLEDEPAARAAIESRGIKGVVVMRPRRAQKTTKVPPETYAQPIYAGYWGGYYPYGWGSSWGDPVSPHRTTHGPQELYPYDTTATVRPGYTEIERVVRVEILIYSLKQNQLVWAGETETENPDEIDDVDTFVNELADLVGDELRRMWLLPS